MNKFNFLTSAKILFKECPISTKLTETEGNKFCNNRKGQSTDDYSSSSLPLQQSCRLPLRIWEIRFFAKWLIIPPHFFSLHLSECLEGLSEIPLGTMECLGSPAHQCSCSPSLHHWQGEQMATSCPLTSVTGLARVNRYQFSLSLITSQSILSLATFSAVFHSQDILALTCQKPCINTCAD